MSIAGPLGYHGSLGALRAVATGRLGKVWLNPKEEIDESERTTVITRRSLTDGPIFDMIGSPGTLRPDWGLSLSKNEASSP